MLVFVCTNREGAFFDEKIKNTNSLEITENTEPINKNNNAFLILFPTILLTILTALASLTYFFKQSSPNLKKKQGVVLAVGSTQKKSTSSISNTKKSPLGTTSEVPGEKKPKEEPKGIKETHADSNTKKSTSVSGGVPAQKIISILDFFANKNSSETVIFKKPKKSKTEALSVVNPIDSEVSQEETKFILKEEDRPVPKEKDDPVPKEEDESVPEEIEIYSLEQVNNIISSKRSPVPLRPLGPDKEGGAHPKDQDILASTFIGDTFYPSGRKNLYI